MDAKSREGDKNWDVYNEEVESTCSCGKGKKIEYYLVASHEKVFRIERDYLGSKIICSTCNPNLD